MAEDIEDVNEEKETLEESSTTEKPENTTALKEYEELQKRITGLKAEEVKVLASLKEKRELRRQLRQTEPAAETVETTPADDLTTVEGWDKHIKETAKKSVEPVMGELEKFKTRQKEKALKKFVEDHPEYSSDKDPEDERMSSLTDLAKRIKGDISELDADDYLEALRDAWAVQNRARIEDESRKFRAQRERADTDEAELATSTGATSEHSEINPINASKSDLRAAKIAGMSLDKYMKLKGQLEENSF